MRAHQSAPKSKTPPLRAESGINALCEPPIAKRTICGATNPINPIIPKKATAIAVHKEEKIKTKIRKVLTLTPLLNALSSPKLNASNFQ